MKVLHNTIIALAAFMVLLGMAISPSSSGPVAGATQAEAPARIMSTMDLQRALNRQYPEAKLAVDGVYGPATRFWHNRASGDQIAIELWPEDAKWSSE